jgi:hypothetical protein
MAYKLKRKEVESKLRELSGNVAVTAQAFGVSRTAIYNFIHKHGLYEVVQEARESMTDIAETSLKRAVINGEAWAVCFTLKTLGKSRGYVERVQQEISGTISWQFFRTGRDSRSWRWGGDGVSRTWQASMLSPAQTSEHPPHGSRQRIATAGRCGVPPREQSRLSRTS